MKPRLFIVLSLGLLIATVAMVGKQRQELRDVRGQAANLESRVETLSNETPAAAEPPGETTSQPGPSLELLRLRSQVGQLERRKRELTGVSEENQRLQARIANAPSETSRVALPASYIRKSEAKFAGFGTPEDSLHSFLWAIAHRDLPTVLQFLGPDHAKEMAAEVERRDSAEDFFKNAGAVPGLLITGREPKDDGAIELTVQIVPNDNETKQKMRFKQFDGQWRLISGF